MMSTIKCAVPVLKVTNILNSKEWYERVLGFSGWAFPESPPHTFALICRDGCELMLQLDQTVATPSGWSVYLRLAGEDLLAVAEKVQLQTHILRGPERMPYGEVEFEIADLDGHVIVISEQLPEHIDIKNATERE